MHAFEYYQYLNDAAPFELAMTQPPDHFPKLLACRVFREQARKDQRGKRGKISEESEERSDKRGKIR
jgi:hypothetical protein